MTSTKASRPDRMMLHRMELFGRHGVFEAERELGQRWIVDLDLRVDLRQAGLTDRLEHSVNYTEIYNTVKRVVEEESYQLIEALTECISDALLKEYSLISEVTVRVTKPHPPFDIHFQGVTIEMTRVRCEPHHIESKTADTKLCGGNS